MAAALIFAGAMFVVGTWYGLWLGIRWGRDNPTATSEESPDHTATQFDRPPCGSRPLDKPQPQDIGQIANAGVIDRIERGGFHRGMASCSDTQFCKCIS